ncbi:acyl-CoA reductase [Croceivirga sp. JEA036]|uniref:acyl-CoA reductase n=1 Tax=Croceivirga sp. JEA036 TaxID=2721162 RepID=UPI001439149C|nr:acyl-CoA reductase [Croceivirga sp. JEA036]NJB35546.1 acyl-CoA reductase [Croceivirga sp. JEA036]
MAEHIPHLKAFVKLGNLFTDFCNKTESEYTDWDQKIADALLNAEAHNGWFTQENCLRSLKAWGAELTEEKLTQWLSTYPEIGSKPSKKIAIIMAGNIPLVGFHDFLSVLLSGHRVLVKLSSNDKILLPLVASYLQEIDSVLVDKIEFTDKKLQDFDAVIATGSNNTGRYFDYYFSKFPSIIRKNRNSVAIIDGTETAEDLALLGNDIFWYFGLGCRSVSKIFIPRDYNFDHFFKGIFAHAAIINNHKYANNYDYNKAVYLMSNYNILDNNFILLKEEKGYASPIGCLFYEYYDNKLELQEKLKADEEQLQCVVAKSGYENTIDFGQTQKPALSDYADGVDTVSFLVSL